MVTSDQSKTQNFQCPLIIQWSSEVKTVLSLSSNKASKPDNEILVEKPLTTGYKLKIKKNNLCCTKLGRLWNKVHTFFNMLLYALIFKRSLGPLIRHEVGENE